MDSAPLCRIKELMEVVNFILCEHVNYSKDWQFNVLGGGISSLSFSIFPVRFAACAVIQIMGDSWETGIDHTLKINIVSEDKLIFEKELPKFRIPTGTVYFITDLILTLQCERPGWYRIDVLIDDQLKREWRLRISEMAVPRSGSQPPIQLR